MLGDIIEHRSGWRLVGQERTAGITHQAELHRKAEPVMLASPNLNLKPVGRRQEITADQAILVGRNVEQRMPILNFEKFPLGHLLLLTFARQ